MLAIPIKGPKEALIIILGEANLTRMEQGDPVEFNIAQMGLKAPVVMVAYEKDPKAVQRFINSADVAGLLKHLQRGWKFCPEQGDHDRGPESIKEGQ